MYTIFVMAQLASHISSSGQLINMDGIWTRAQLSINCVLFQWGLGWTFSWQFLLFVQSQVSTLPGKGTSCCSVILSQTKVFLLHYNLSKWLTYWGHLPFRRGNYYTSNCCPPHTKATPFSIKSLLQTHPGCQTPIVHSCHSREIWVRSEKSWSCQVFLLGGGCSHPAYDQLVFEGLKI